MRARITSVAVVDKNTRLPHPDYYSDFWNSPHDVFGCKTSGLMYEYDDRLLMREYDKWTEGEAKAKATCVERSCAYYEVVLSHYFGKLVTIKHIVGGVNKQSGYPWYAFGFTC